MRHRAPSPTLALLSSRPRPPAAARTIAASGGLGLPRGRWSSSLRSRAGGRPSAGARRRGARVKGRPSNRFGEKEGLSRPTSRARTNQGIGLTLGTGVSRRRHGRHQKDWGGGRSACRRESERFCVLRAARAQGAGRSPFTTRGGRRSATPATSSHNHRPARGRTTRLSPARTPAPIGAEAVRPTATLLSKGARSNHARRAARRRHLPSAID